VWELLCAYFVFTIPKRRPREKKEEEGKNYRPFLARGLRTMVQAVGFPEE